MKILFLGNSHTFFNDMPQTLALLARAAGHDTEVGMIAHGGKSLEWHLNEAVELRFSLLYGKYDYIIVQQAAHTPPAPPSAEETARDVLKISEMARSVGTKTIATVTWAERDFPEHQSEMNRAYNLIMEQSELCCSPAGGVFMEIKNTRPDIDLYWRDGAHCSPYGSYAVACCVFSQVFSASPEGLPALGFATGEGGFKECTGDIPIELDKDKCAAIQEAAWRHTVNINKTRRLEL